MRLVKRVAIFLLVVLLAVGGVAWWQRVELRSWYVLRGLSKADADRDTWVEQAVALGDPLLRPLCEMVQSDDDQAASNAIHALCSMTTEEAADRRPEVADKFARAFPRLTDGNQQAVLRCVRGWCDAGAVADLVSPSARMLAEVPANGDEATRKEALLLATALVKKSENAELTRAARALTTTGLRSTLPENRLLAICLSLQPRVDLAVQVEGLLRDSNVEVRRAAVVAIGPVEQVRDEGLLFGLHDSDAEVRKLTESALRARGLHPEHLELGRLLTHPHAPTRLDVLDRLREANDLDPGIWLRRLSHDDSPAVRAAAVRVMSQFKVLDLTDRMDQMANSDPSPTVSQLARHYLSKKRAMMAPVER